MDIFERISVFLVYSSFAFVIIMSMRDLGKCIGIEQMEELGISFIFGAAYLHLALMNEKKKDKEQEKDGVN